MGFERGVRVLWRLLWAPLSWNAAVSPLKTSFVSPVLPPHQRWMKVLQFGGRLVSHWDGMPQKCSLWCGITGKAQREQWTPVPFRGVFIKLFERRIQNPPDKLTQNVYNRIRQKKDDLCWAVSLAKWGRKNDLRHHNLSKRVKSTDCRTLTKVSDLFHTCSKLKSN